MDLCSDIIQSCSQDVQSKCHKGKGNKRKSGEQNSISYSDAVQSPYSPGFRYFLMWTWQNSNSVQYKYTFNSCVVLCNLGELQEQPLEKRQKNSSSSSITASVYCTTSKFEDLVKVLLSTEKWACSQQAQYAQPLYTVGERRTQTLHSKVRQSFLFTVTNMHFRAWARHSLSPKEISFHT